MLRDITAAGRWNLLKALDASPSLHQIISIVRDVFFGKLAPINWYLWPTSSHLIRTKCKKCRPTGSQTQKSGRSEMSQFLVGSYFFRQIAILCPAHYSERGKEKATPQNAIVVESVWRPRGLRQNTRIPNRKFIIYSMKTETFAVLLIPYPRHYHLSMSSPSIPPPLFSGLFMANSLNSCVNNVQTNFDVIGLCRHSEWSVYWFERKNHQSSCSSASFTANNLHTLHTKSTHKYPIVSSITLKLSENIAALIMYILSSRLISNFTNF